MRGTAVIAPLAVSMALCACGGSGSTTTKTVTTSNSTATQTSTAGSTATSTTPAASGAPLCVAADLTPAFLGQQGATGHGLLGFSLRNTSGHTCHTFGFPGVLFLDRAGRALPTASTRTTHDFFGVAPARALTLAPGTVVSFRIGVTHGVTSTAHCTTAYGLQVIPPNDTATLRVTIPGGAYECATATVSPLQPGTSAYS